jgi:hypothetical protein
MATTASGYPYVVPADHPKEYPAASQALANLLQTRFAGLKVQAGTGLTAANGKVTITFPVAFTVAPHMVATMLIQNGFVIVDAAPTTTTAAVTTYTHAGAAVAAYFSWVAVGS